MKPEAVQQTYERLERARGAAAILADQSRTMGEFSVAWSNSIMAINNIYSKLEQGAKGNKKSEYWYGKEKHCRRKDHLLRYMHAARNSDEHTLELISGAGVLVESLQEGILVSNDKTMMNPRIDLKEGIQHEPGTPLVKLTVGFYPQPVTNTRFNNRFEPPDSHLGQSITDRTASGIATLALKYVEKMVADANELTH